MERRSLVKKSLLSAAGEASHATHETESEGFFFKRKSDRKSLRTSQSTRVTLSEENVEKKSEPRG